jgi:hypothetical protein
MTERISLEAYLAEVERIPAMAWVGKFKLWTVD